LTLLDDEQFKPRVQDVIEQLMGIEREQTALLRIKRTGMFYKERDVWHDPMQI